MFAHVANGTIDRFILHRPNSLGGGQVFVAAHLNFGLNIELYGNRQRLLGLEINFLKHRVVDRLQSARLDLVADVQGNQLVEYVLADFVAIALPDHVYRCLATPKALHLGPLLENSAHFVVNTFLVL